MSVATFLAGSPSDRMLAQPLSNFIRIRSTPQKLVCPFQCCSVSSSKRRAVSLYLRQQPLASRSDRNDAVKLSAVPDGQPYSRVAVEGDTVTVHFTVFGEKGERMESSRDVGQPLTFEVGSSDVVGNELLQTFDGGVRGLSLGGKRRVELEPLQEEWNQDLLFNVPKDHQEVQRLEGKFRSNGGLQEGMIVELTNGAQAQVVKLTPETVILDANNAMAGRKIAFEIELVEIE